MLYKLHEQINQIVSINGVTVRNDGTYFIDYISEPTPEQVSQVNDILDSWPLSLAKLEKYDEIETWWNNIIESGWQTQYGWKLGLSIQDVTLLTGAFILSKEAQNLGINNPAVIVDSDGISHELSFSDFTTLMFQYGNHRSILSQEYAAKKNTVKNATSISELNNI